MDADVAEPPATSTAYQPGRSGRTERRCVLFGCLEAAAWIISDLYGGELAVCDGCLLSDAPCPRATRQRHPGRGLAAGAACPARQGVNRPRSWAVIVTGPGSAGRARACWSVGLQAFPTLDVLPRWSCQGSLASSR